MTIAAVEKAHTRRRYFCFDNLNIPFFMISKEIWILLDKTFTVYLILVTVQLNDNF